MIVAAAGDWLVDVATLAGALATIVGFLILVSKLKWLRWVLGRLVYDPIDNHVSSTVAKAVDAKINGSLDRVESKLDLHIGVCERNQARLLRLSMTAVKDGTLDPEIVDEVLLTLETEEQL